MDNLIVKPVDVLGTSVMAARDKNGNIFAGVNYFCNALGMSKGQRDKQVQKVQKDEILKNGCFRLEAGAFDPSNESIALRIDFLPIWLAKIAITGKTRQENPELANKLLEYQLKAKDILAAAFLPQQVTAPLTLQQQIQTIAKGTEELYQRVDAVDTKLDIVKSDLEAFKLELPLFPEDADEVKNALNRKVVDYLGGKDSNAYHDKSICRKAFSDAYRELKRNFSVGSYKSIKRNQKVRALEVIEAYRPPVVLLDDIQMANAQQNLNV